MIYNFKSEIARTCHDEITKQCLMELYKAEEDGKSDPNVNPNTIFYENVVDKYYNKRQVSGVNLDEA
jgi:hypothetical protein